MRRRLTCIPSSADTAVDLLAPLWHRSAGRASVTDVSAEVRLVGPGVGAVRLALLVAAPVALVSQDESGGLVEPARTLRVKTCSIRPSGLQSLTASSRARPTPPA